MSVAVPPDRVATGPANGPTTAPRPIARRSGPEWLPVIGWFIEDGTRHTRINVIPLGNSVDPTERFAVTLKFFRGSDTPVHTFVSPPFAGDDNFRYEGEALLQALGATAFDGLVEITARSLDHPPSHFPWVDSWLEFWADDGSLNGSVPGFVFKGGTTKRIMSGKWQHWPGIAANARYSSSVLLLNYHPRATEARLDLFSPAGHERRSSSIVLPPRMPLVCDLESAVPEARTLLEAEGGYGSLRVWSAYKVPGFVLMRNRESGVITSFDHTVPFAGTPIE